MRKKLLSLDQITESLFSSDSYKQELFNMTDNRHRKMIDLMKNIMAGELTERQRVCMCKYYVDAMKMVDIADELGIGVSSVSRHIKKAKNRVEKTMKYYF